MSAATTDPRAVRALKALTPQSAKDAAESGIRMATAATARWRPAPDFLVIGTKRGGTTTLWNALEAHPQVQPMVPAAKHLKSPHYFYWHYHRGPSWYLGHFPTSLSRARHARVHGRSVVGEASPMYLLDPRVAPRVAAMMPETKIVVSLRDPVQRAVSHWRERVKEGVEPLSFPDALAAEDDRLAGELDRIHADPDYYSRPLDWYSYRTRGEYAGQLERWFEHFDRSQVLVLRAEDLYLDQESTLRRAHEFLGLAPHAVAAQWHNRTSTTPIPEDVRRSLTQHFQPHNERLATLLGADNWWPAIPFTNALRS